jgi:hypothetical protein
MGTWFLRGEFLSRGFRRAAGYEGGGVAGGLRHTSEISGKLRVENQAMRGTT